MSLTLASETIFALTKAADVPLATSIFFNVIYLQLTLRRYQILFVAHQTSLPQVWSIQRNH